uniref:Uncharacterized protein n=1 Tax=Eutreptiella gymnastica TaxID=73025 RepID=A0A7S1IDR9_9EUGL
MAREGVVYALHGHMRSGLWGGAYAGGVSSPCVCKLVPAKDDDRTPSYMDEMGRRSARSVQEESAGQPLPLSLVFCARDNPSTVGYLHTCSSRVQTRNLGCWCLLP